MSSKRLAAAQSGDERWYRGAKIPRAVIRRFAREVADRFHPDKIILFGSYAYGTPTATWTSSSSCRHATSSTRRSRAAWRFPPLSRTEIVTKGKVLYAASRQGIGAKG